MRFIKAGNALWWLGLAAFTVIGITRWTQFFNPAPPDFQARDADLDALAWQRFGLKDGAAKLRGEIAPYPPDAPLVIFGPGDDWTLTEAYFLISYLAWPRPVWYIGMMPEGQPVRFSHPPPPGVHPAAVFFYKIAPPAFARAHAVSPDLTLGEFP